MKLEEKISLDENSYIHSMDFNWKERQFTLNLIKSPRSLNKTDKKVIFSNVNSFKMDEETNRSPDQIKEINEYNKDNMIEYVFLTEQRTFMFSTDKEPLLSDLP